MECFLFCVCSVMIITITTDCGCACACLGRNYSSDPSSGHEIFRSRQDTRDKTRGDRGDDELIHYPGQHGHGPAANTHGGKKWSHYREI